MFDFVFGEGFAKIPMNDVEALFIQEGNVMLRNPTVEQLNEVKTKYTRDMYCPAGIWSTRWVAFTSKRGDDWVWNVFSRNPPEQL